MKLSLRLARPAHILVWLLVTFLVLFPKGGVRIANVPLTWGYLLLGTTFLPLLPIRLLVLPVGLSRIGLIAAATTIPFQLLFFYSYLQNGMENPAYAVAVGTCFIFLPAVFLLVYPAFYQFVDSLKLRRHLCFCILAAAIFGILMFFYHPIMGKYIEIPFLTVNAGDYGLLESTKHIDRGGYLKLISTYNNGNVYGVATLILLPLYLKLEPALWKRNTVRIALVLTLSRTVWLGLILEQAFSVAAQLPNLVRRFPRIRPGRAMKQAFALAATCVLVFLGPLFFNISAAALFLDRDLGGRTGEIAAVAHPTILPNVPLTAFSEVLYASALVNFGVFGFFAIVLIFFTPFVFLLAVPRLRHSSLRRAAGKGLVLYAFVATADGATVLIPVMAFYWFAYMVMLYGFPGEQASGPAMPHKLSPQPRQRAA